MLHDRPYGCYLKQCNLVSNPPRKDLPSLMKACHDFNVAFWYYYLLSKSLKLVGFTKDDCIVFRSKSDTITIHADHRGHYESHFPDELLKKIGGSIVRKKWNGEQTNRSLWISGLRFYVGYFSSDEYFYTFLEAQNSCSCHSLQDIHFMIKLMKQPHLIPLYLNDPKVPYKYRTLLHESLKET